MLVACIFLLQMSHIVMYKSQGFSKFWRVKAKVQRRIQKEPGYVLVTRGKQSLHYNQETAQSCYKSSATPLFICGTCKSRRHVSSTCPVANM